MKQTFKLVIAGLLSVGIFSTSAVAQTPAPKAAPAPKGIGETKPLLPSFPDFGHLPPPGGYQGRLFKLSQNFPKTKPPLDAGVKKILSIDFKKDWNGYMTAVRDYIYEGNIENRPVSEAFYLEDNKVRPWFHVPWQHWGDFGREGVHGLTKEGPVNPKVLGPTQTNLWQTYAVGFYNQQGGWTIGRVWNNPDNPNLVTLQKEGFPEGTVVGKVLFTTAPVSEVPFLTAPIEWVAYTTKCFAPANDAQKGCDSEREMTKVRFIQMDIMVRDSRAKETGGWVFGTFVYNGNLAKPNMWQNVVPVGLQWGNDPSVTSHSDSNPQPTETKFNPDLKEVVINPSKEMPPMHLGWGLRLNGPVDNTKSSCMSCHSTAQYPEISPILPFMAKKNGQALQPPSPEWMRWFRNVQCNTPFDEQGISTDYSLQLAASVQNFIVAKGQQVGGAYSIQYWNGLPVNTIVGKRGVGE